MQKTKEKNNIEHLRYLLTKGQDERLEFLEAIKAEMKVKDQRISALEKINNDLESSLDGQDLEEEAFPDIIHTGIGTIEFRIETGNLQLASLMEVFEEKIKKHTPRKIEEVLSSL